MNETTTLQCRSPFGIGSISHGTMQPCDVALAIHTEIDYANAYRNAGINIPDPYENFEGFDCEDPFWDTEEASEYVAELFDLMNEHAPPYCVFGAHEGDGSDYGFWPIDIDEIKEQVEFSSVRSLSDARQLEIETAPEDSTRPPVDFRGEWLHVNDHGNCTLYVREEAPLHLYTCKTELEAEEKASGLISGGITQQQAPDRWEVFQLGGKIEDREIWSIV